MANRKDDLGSLSKAYVLNKDKKVIENMWRDAMEDNYVKLDTGVKIGKVYFIETLTKYYIGEVVEIDFSYIILNNWTWIPNTGRFNEFMKTGNPEENEPAPPGILKRIPHDVITSIDDWPHPIPQEVK